MKILGVLSLLGATSAFAVTTPATDIYSDSLTIERASAEVPGSLEASHTEEMESVADVVESAKPRTKKRASK